MKQGFQKKRLVTRLILLTVLLIAIPLGWYLTNRRYEYTATQNDKEVSNILNSYTENKKDTALSKPGVIKADSSVPALNVKDTAGNTKPKIKPIKVNKGKAVSPIKAETQNTNVSGPVAAKANDIVTEKNGKWRIVIKDDILHVYPVQKWKNIVVAYPFVPVGKEKKWLFRPDFPGVVYISDTSADIDVSGIKYRAIIEKFTAAEANSKMPFFISLKRHPEFIVFGESEDLQNWYIYTKNQLSEYTPTMNPGNKYTLNSQ